MAQLTIYCFDNAVSQRPFNTFKCTKRTTAYCTVQYMDPWMDDRTNRLPGKRGKTWRRILSTNFIQFQPHYLHIWIESGISRWRNPLSVAPSTFTWGRFGYFLWFRLFQIPVSPPSIKWPWKVFFGAAYFHPGVYNYIYIYACLCLCI